MATFILSAAIRAVKSRVGTWRAYEAVVGVVPEVTRDEWATAIGQARAGLAQRTSELTRPLNRRPLASEFGSPLAYSTSHKFWQTVEIYVRDRDTSARSTWYHVLKTDTLRSRVFAIRDGIDKVQGIIEGRPDDYPVDIVGFSYTGTYPIVPKGR